MLWNYIYLPFSSSNPFRGGSKLSIRGFPNKIYSDGGSQLVGASSELKAVYSNLDCENIKSCGSSVNLEWVFSPGDTPWYNGCCEALIKSVNTILYEVASLINERPIGRKPNQADDGSYLCPNDVLLGRSSTKLPYQNLGVSSKLKKQHQFVQQLTDYILGKMDFLFP